MTTCLKRFEHTAYLRINISNHFFCIWEKTVRLLVNKLILNIYEKICVEEGSGDHS